VLHIYPEELKMQVTQVQPDNYALDNTPGPACFTYFVWVVGGSLLLYAIVRLGVKHGMMAAHRAQFAPTAAAAKKASRGS
jgi:hypothetical protein